MAHRGTMSNAVQEMRATESDEWTWRAMACLDIRFPDDAATSPAQLLALSEDVVRRVSQAVRSEAPPSRPLTAAPGRFVPPSCWLALGSRTPGTRVR